MTRLITKTNDPILIRMRAMLMRKDNDLPEGPVVRVNKQTTIKPSKIMEGKIKITDKSMLKKIAAAAEQAGVKLKEPFTAGGAVHQPLTFRDPAHLFDFGMIVATISEKEVADYEARMKAKAEKKAAA